MSFPIGDDFQSGNFRSEARWERQACEALSLCEEVDNLCLTNPVWTSTTSPMPRNLQNVYNNNCAVLMQGFQPELFKLQPKHGFIVNAYAHSMASEDEQLVKLKLKYGHKLVITSGWLNYHNLDAIKSICGPEHYADLYLPHIPKVISASNNYANKILLWSGGDFQGNVNERTKPILEWTAKKLMDDPSLEFHLCSGYTHEGVQYRGHSSLDDLFWSSSHTEPLAKVKAQCKLHLSMSWRSMLDMYSKTKLVVSPILPGGQPIECSMYGIPHVGDARTFTGPMSGLSSYLVQTTLEDDLAKLENFMTNEAAYSGVGETYRNFVNATYTYEKFCQQIVQIVLDRKMHP